MDKYTAAEQAYKNGYEQGKKDAVKHGRWELYSNDDTLGCSYFCSLCGANYDEEFFEENMPFRFCPICGAKMDLEGEK